MLRCRTLQTDCRSRLRRTRARTVYCVLAGPACVPVGVDAAKPVICAGCRYHCRCAQERAGGCLREIYSVASVHYSGRTACNQQLSTLSLGALLPPISVRRRSLPARPVIGRYRCGLRRRMGRGWWRDWR